MPGRVKVRKMSATQESEIRMRTLAVLLDSDEALTTDQIKSRDIVLAPITSQKMSRILNYLLEMGFVRKAKSKVSGRMVYKAVSKMQEQGYDVPAAADTMRPYNGLEWDFEDSIMALANKGEDEEDED